MDANDDKEAVVERVTTNKDTFFFSAYTDNYSIENIEWQKLSASEHEALKQSEDYWLVKPVELNGSHYCEAFERDVDIECLFG